MQKINSWLEIDQQSDFTIYNFPFGIGVIDGEHFVVSRIGDQVINLSVLADSGLVNISDSSVLKSQYLNDYMSLGKEETVPFRERLIELFSNADYQEKASESLVDASAVQMVLPIDIRDYTDFYSSREHATNLGCLFRDPENALMPNWLHLPVGYHGRASSIIVSGDPVHRPSGQQRPDPEKPPVYGPCKLLDIELEMGFVIGKKTENGTSIPTSEAKDYIFGLALFNDWSARDIQKWEYVPLGPFLGKNFASTLAPWIVTLEALEPFIVPGPKQDPEVLDYLKYEGDHNYDVDLFVTYETAKGAKQQVSHSNFKFMYWNMLQQLAHHTVNGCNINVGDLYASGTISGQDNQSYGSLLEITEGGKHQFEFENGETRKFLQDGDTIYLNGRCEKGHIKLGFGECKATIVG